MALTTDVPDPVERFRSVLYTDGGDDIYGVIRMSVLRQIAPFNSYHWADRTFVAELALHGPFHNEPDFLYFRRDHPMRTSAAGTQRHPAALFSAGSRAGEPLATSSRASNGEYVLGFVSAIRRAPLSSRGPSAVHERASRLARQPCQSEAPERADEPLIQPAQPRKPRSLSTGPQRYGQCES